MEHSNGPIPVEHLVFGVHVSFLALNCPEVVLGPSLRRGGQAHVGTVISVFHSRTFCFLNASLPVYSSPSLHHLSGSLQQPFDSLPTSTLAFNEPFPKAGPSRLFLKCRSGHNSLFKSSVSDLK